MLNFINEMFNCYTFFIKEIFKVDQNIIKVAIKKNLTLEVDLSNYLTIFQFVGVLIENVINITVNFII